MKNQAWDKAEEWRAQLTATLLASKPNQFLSSYPVYKHRIDVNEAQYAHIVRCVKNAEALAKALDGCLTWLNRERDRRIIPAVKQGEKALKDWQSSAASHPSNSESSASQQ